VKTFFLLLLVSYTAIGQKQEEINIIDQTAFVNKREFVKIKKKNKNKFIISSINNDEKLIIVNLFKSLHISGKYHKLPRLKFLPSKSTIDFEWEINEEEDIIRLLRDWRFIQNDGSLDNKIVASLLKRQKTY